MSDLEWLRAKDHQRREQLAEQLRHAEEEARRAGKEPFDFARLCELYDPSSELSSSSELPDPQAVAEDLERKYYLDFPEVRSVAEFAERLKEIKPYR